ncbi:hypothetical protein PENTCL1PPCAC_29696, partial [Pristionchus entomophagus]
LVEASVTEAPGSSADAAAAAAPPSAASPTDAAASPAAPVAERPSLNKRTWDKIASHVSRVSELREDNEDDFHVEFANDAIRVFQGLISGRCISGPLISNLNNICYSHAEDDAAGTQALLLLGRALRKAAESRNEQFTVADGLKPGKYGLPELRPPKPPMPRTDSESPEPSSLKDITAAKKEFALDHEIKTEQPVEENLCFTSGDFIGNNASYVDVSRIKHYKGPVKHIDDISELRMTERRMPNDKPRPLNAPFKPFEYRYDEAGNLLVKSEMMGDDEFFDHQVNLRRIGQKYEQIARRGVYEERFIMKHMGTGYERKRYECDQCGIICANQHKYASHVRHSHPKSQKEREEIARVKAVRAAELKEEKKRKDALLPRLPLVERERRERRPLVRRPSGAGLLPATFTTPTASDKIYVCPICNEEVASQHVFASHMRYTHPKDGTNASMVGRRATVKRIAKEEEDTAPATIDTPESALNALSSVLSASRQMLAPVVRRTKTLPDGTGAYKCRVCGRTFDNLNACAGHTRHCIAAHNAAPSPPKPTPQRVPFPQPTDAVDTEEDEDQETEEDDNLLMEAEENMEDGLYRCRVCGRTFNNPNSVAGHTRHCLAAHGGEPSPRALARRKAKGNNMPTHIIKTEPLPESPLADVNASSSAPPATAAEDGVDMLRHLRPKKPLVVPSSSTPLAAAPSPVLHRAVKLEPLDEPAKPVGRTTRNSAAAAMEPPPQLQPAVEPLARAASVAEGRRPTRSSMAATGAAAPSENGHMATPPSSSRPALAVVSTRSSRSSARLISPTPSDYVPPQLVAQRSASASNIMPPPAKRPRTSTGNFDREVKHEPMDEEDYRQSMDRPIKQETMDAGDDDTPRRRITKADKKLAKTSFRGLETEAARTCYYCHVLCTTIHAGDRHIRLKHPGRAQIYSCSECASPFLTLGGLENHWTKSEHCPRGHVMVVGKSIFDLDEEVKLRSPEVKQHGLSEEEIEKNARAVEKKEEEEVPPVEKIIIKTEAKKVKEEKVESPAPAVKKVEKIVIKPVEKPQEKVAEKKVEKKLVDVKIESPIEKREEKQTEKKEEKKLDKPIEKTVKVSPAIEKLVEKPIEK